MTIARKVRDDGVTVEIVFEQIGLSVARLDGAQTIQQHAAALANKYSVDVPLVVNDLLELAEKMAADALVDAVT